MKFLSSLTKKNLVNKICLLRIDLNIQDVDLSKNHLRILAVLPTIKFLIDRGARVVILSHRGRPVPLKRKISNFQFPISKQFTLKPFVKILSYLLKKPVRFIDFNFLSLRGVPLSGTTKQSNNLTEIASLLARNDTERQFRNLTSGDILLLENLRFFDSEEKNDEKFAKQLASLGDFYVNDAFAVSHRKNASVAAITKYLPSYAGLLMEKEINNLDKVRGFKKSGLVVILGGAKISDKIGLIKNFLTKVKCILVGGGMANTFLAAQGLPVGDSLYDKNADLRGLNKLLRLNLNRLILPIDTIIYKRRILDIGPKTVEKYSKIIENAKTIIWNGPMGYIEDKKFKKGSEAIAKAIIKNKAFSIIGGGETVSLLRNTRNYAELRGKNQRLFISTGGGAMLEYLAGKKLPGIEALK